MKNQFLHNNWKMTVAGKDDFISATVPGSVYNDLLSAGKMEDPYWRDNEMKSFALMDNDFLYTTTFDVEKEILDSDKVLLHFDGLDTLADITLNGVLLGSAFNMHRYWEYDVKHLLKESGNTLEVLFYSPTKYVAHQNVVNHSGGSWECTQGFPALRKAHCMFGWDWGPRLPDAGIWRDVKLCGINGGRIISTHILQNHEDGKVTLDITPEIESVTGKELSYEITITTPDGVSTTYENSPKEIVVENPKLWWPNGLGEQPLYTVCVNLLNDGEVVDVWERRIGLRTLTMHIEKDEFGESFAHEVNGVQFFAMGADYIPEDNILPRVNPERTRNLLEQAIAANHNCIRVWGGGHYPHDYFYDICDELGLVVWQDFMFACAHYNLTEEFEENLKAEFEQNVKRLRHHASLGLWCGNNEMETFTKGGVWEPTPRQVGDYIRLYEYIIPKICKKLDPQTFYWPSSPSSGGSFDNPDDPNRGDVHYWSVWHGNLPFVDYRNHFFRYVSEFGFQSFPSIKTIETFTEPEDRNIFSYVMEKHQRNNSANQKIMSYLGQTFLYPNNFEKLLYCSQLLQAEALKFGVEHWRRNRGRCMGTVVWQLNDCWPVASWASIDYCNRWKALHYYEKRFFAPVLLSCEEESLLANIDPNRECKDLNSDTKKSIRLNVTNETLSEQKVTVKWKLCNNRSEVLLDGGETELTVPPMSAVWMDKVDLPQANIFTDYVRFEMYQDGKMVSASSVIFSVPKYYKYLDPQLEAHIEGDEVVVTSKAYAHCVEILNENEDWILDDNYIDMDAGETRRIKIIKGNADNIKVRSVYDIR